MMVLKLAVKNLLSRKSSIVIILFVSFAVTLFCVSNAVFDSTEQGVQTTYVSSFTGDVMIRPKSSGQMSLFGDETPVTGELTVLNHLVPYIDLVESLKNQKFVSGFTPQVTCMAAMEANGNRRASYLFGVHGDEYLDLMESIHIVSGEAFSAGQKGIMVCDKTAEKLNVSVGDEIQFVVAEGPNFRIRAAPVTAIYTYDVYNDIFERFALVDADTVRSLLDVDSGSIVSEEYISDDLKNLLSDDFDMDNLFDDFSDTDAIWDLEEDSFDYSDFKFETTDSAEITETTYIPSNTWTYLIVSISPYIKTEKAIKKLNKFFNKNKWPLQATDWRHAAGSTSLYLYWMRIIFNIGISIVLVAGFIIVNNTLVVNVLDRTQEIGTLRAIGTRKRFISLECMAETFFMTIISGILGVIFGEIVCHFITKAHIVLTNSFLIQLFGGEALNIYVTGGNIFKMFLLVILLGVLGWIYPVINAVKISPVRAMQGGR